MRKITLVCMFLVLCFSVIPVYAELSTDQKEYISGSFTWVDDPTNIQGDAIVLPNARINYTMAYSTSYGKWYHFVIGNASAAASGIGTATTATLDLSTVPINVDGFNKATISPYMIRFPTQAFGSLNRDFLSFADTQALKVALYPKISILPYTDLDDLDNAESFLFNAPINVASAGTAQLGAGAAITTMIPSHFSLMGAKSLIISVSEGADFRTGVTSATTCFFLGLTR